MNIRYESTRNKSIKVSDLEALLSGLSPDGGLYVMRDLEKNKVDISKLIDNDYYHIATQILKFFFDMPIEDINDCIQKAYKGKFSNEEITPVKELEDGYVLELFNGPTSAFKDIGLQLLPRLMTKAIQKHDLSKDILILTATSGDTGKAALEGFKDVEGTKIIAFYPYKMVSHIQELQMTTQEGKNVKAVAIKGNFDDAQTGVKTMFTDKVFQEKMSHMGIQLSSANSINIGRLAAQVVYYFYAYISMINKNKIKPGDKINFVVPTGNFGNILAGYYAKMMGLPVNKFICASNSNNVLYDFLATGIYDKNREFLKTISPSMDILVSSNLERLLYYMSGCDNEYIRSLMKELDTKGKYTVTKEIYEKISNCFCGGYANDEETIATIKKIYDRDHYLVDTHTAVAYKVFDDIKDKDGIREYKTVVLSTASPYKFAKDVCKAFDKNESGDEITMMQDLKKISGCDIPKQLFDLENKQVLHKDVIEKEDMEKYVVKSLEAMK